MRVRRSVAGLALVGLVAAGLGVTVTSPAVASQPSVPAPAFGDMPGAVPSTATPPVNDGQVDAIATVGSVVVIGGTFTSVAGQPRTKIAAFQRSTGALTGFAPTLDGDVTSILPGPNDHTVYLGGAFTTVNGTARKFVALVDLDTSALVTSFAGPTFDYGKINDMEVRGNRLYVGGFFSKVGGKAHFGLASLNATTGALDPFVNNQVAGRHNDSGSGAQGWIGPWDLAISPDGQTMIAIGNFKTVDGLLRDQVVNIDLSGSSAVVRPDWATSRYSPYCFSWAFDSYVRGVAFSPDGSYFVINATGGPSTNTLCDATARFETAARGTDLQPTWVNESGGDTMWGIAISDTAVFVGGHARWNNNPFGSDNASPGAVPRPGLAALDPATGRPLAWNPGRNPAGKAVFSMLATAEGLYVGSDTDWIGDRTYQRKKIAFFPYSSGSHLAPTTIGSLPGTAFLGGSKAGGTTNVLYRVNAAGPAILSSDSGPDWLEDSGSTSPYRNSGSNAATWSALQGVDSTVPAGTPASLFLSERWSPSDNPAMKWAFPVPAGTPLQVRLYFANGCSCTQTVGARRFNVSIDGSQVLSDFDIVAAVGHQRGTMRSFDITSDGSVNIDTQHVVENPLINGIEIVRTDVTPTPGGGASLAKVAVTSASASPAQIVDAGGIDWSQTRGAFMVGSTVFYGNVDGSLYRTSFDGTTFGTPSKVSPYHDPAWKDVSNNLGGTYDGNNPSLYPQLPNVTGLAYYQGRLYYTLFNDPTLRWRWFHPDAGVMDERTFTVPSSVNFSDANGMFVDGGKLYYVTKSNGNLNSVSFDGTVTGAPTVVDGPGLTGNNWSNKSMFLSSVKVNQGPTAAFTSSCTGADCSFDGSGSADLDGTVSSYSWSFGDGSAPGSGATPTHTYASSGTYSVTLTVTDDNGATATVSHDVEATVPSNPVAFVDAVHGAAGATKTKTLTVPAGVQAGDTLVLTLSQPNTKPFGDPAGVTGLTQQSTVTNVSMTSTLWTKAAEAGDAGKAVTVTSATYAKAALSLVVYRGVNTGGVVVANTVDSATADHVSPTVDAPAGSWVATWWIDKSSTTDSWTAPSGVTTRDTMTDTASGRYGFLLADTGAPVVSGPYGGLTATTNATSEKGVSWTVALPPSA